MGEHSLRNKKVEYGWTFAREAIRGWREAAMLATDPAHRLRLLRLADQLAAMSVPFAANDQAVSLHPVEDTKRRRRQP